MAIRGQNQEATNVDSSSLGAWFDEYPWLEPLDQLLQQRHGELLRGVEERLAKSGVGGVVLGSRCNPASAMLLHHGGKEKQEKQESASPEDTSEAGSATSARQDAPQDAIKDWARWTSEEDYETLAQQRSIARQKSRENKETEEVEVDTSFHRKLADMVESKYFEGFFALLIITNSLVIGAQVEYSSHHVHVVEAPLFFRVLEQLYAFLFFVELVLRMVAGGRRFFCSSDMGAIFWSYFDMLIVGSSVFELVLQIVAATEDSGGGGGTSDLTGQAKILRIVRITRVIRVMRVLRVVKFIRALASLISSIFYTLKSLAWSLFLLLMIIYVFGILFADTVLSHVSAFPAKDELAETSEEYQLYLCFGSLLLSMHTLFRSISGGMDWGTQIDLLFHIHWAWGYLFLAYIAFCYFAVLNVMTAVFCQRAIESSRYDPDYQIQQMLAEQDRCAEVCGQIFNILDSIVDGTITRAELVEHFEEESVKALFQSLDLVASDPCTLFKLLDEAGNGDIDHEEFISGCMKMKGPAKAVDIAWMMRESSHVKKDIANLREFLHTLAMQLGGVTTSLAGLQAKVNHEMPTLGKPKEDDEDTEDDRCSGPMFADLAEDSKDTPMPPSVFSDKLPAAPHALPPSFMVGPRAAGFGFEPERQRQPERQRRSWHRQARQSEQRRRGLATDVEDIPYDIGPELQVHLPGRLPN